MTNLTNKCLKCLLKGYYYPNSQNHISHKLKIIKEIVLVYRGSAQENRRPSEGCGSVEHGNVFNFFTFYH